MAMNHETGAAGAVCAAAAPDAVDGNTALVALARVPAARAELDRAEAALIAAARAAGAPWSRIAIALGLGSYQAAAQRAARLFASTGHPTNPAAADPESTSPESASPDPRTPQPVSPRHDHPQPAPPSTLGSASTSGSAELPPEPATEPPARRTGTGRTGTGRRRTALTAPSVTTIAQRRRVTAADFHADPLHELTRTTDPGRWQVHDPTTVIGEVHRHARRWQPTTPTGEPLGPTTYPTRAEAALHVITAHHTLANRRPISTRR